MDEPIRFPSFHVIRALPAAGPITCALFLFQAAVAGLTGPITALASGVLIAAIIGGNEGRAVAAAAFLGIAFALEPLVGASQGMLGNRLGMRLSQQFRDRVMAAALRPDDLAVLEDPSTSDLLSSALRIEQEGMPMREVVIRSGARLTQRVRVVVMAAILGGYLPWAGPLLLAAAISSRWLTRNVAYEEVDAKPWARVVNHRGDYYESLAIDPPAAKEIRVFGLGDLFAGRLAALRELFYDHVREARRAALPRQLMGVAAGVLPVGLVLVAIGTGVISGHVSAAALAVQLQAIFGVLDLSGDDSWLRRGGVAAARVLQIETALGTPSRRRGSAAVSSRPPEIRFERVTFAYPGASMPVLQQLDLEIPAGAATALVGLNGAGKTTLIKLLAGLYRPSAGRILVDGADLAELSTEAWSSRLAIVFQDFLRLELTARENVAFSHGDDAALERVGAAAALDGVISALPRGWDTTLSRAYRDGTDLSGGEWQRIALARAVYSVEQGARLVVLDEPTAHLDVRAEAATFERFLELTRGLTVVLVSHRYSTVRHADRVAVLEGGHIAEIGSPGELLDRPSRYARMFRAHRRLAEAGR